MANLKFADTHNMVAFLSKPDESDAFEQIVDFLNAHPIKYALTVNPTIYTSCIERFWSTVKAKTISGEVQLHALVDGKKIIVTESTVRRDLQLEDAEGLQVQQKKDDIFISQDKYVMEILKKFRFTEVKTASTLMETQKPLLKDENVCACARYQVNPKVSHLHVVKRIYRYLKGQPKLGLWYLKDSFFDLVAYTDSDYARASLDRKFTTGGCQFLRCRLISWQCKKQTVVVNSTTEAEFVAALICCGQVIWIQNQLLDYGYNYLIPALY
ncbi:hypothetical protein Tco_0080387 [Tanacetum coccineum]